jgi:predicted unusual protein kinase regulating ubiquinone biosynthesis (AarF/ABC1/UbiB family)
MTTGMSVVDLLRELPEDQEVTPPSACDPPTGPCGRLWEVGSLQVQVGLAWLLGRLRRSFADAEAAERIRVETNLRIAVTIVRRMGYLRGALAKLGQVAASSSLLPREVLDVMDALHFQVPPMSEESVREVLFDELQGTPEGLFAEFETRPIAAATLGQVHRARLRTGEPVAVKVQYPGIARAIEHDLRALSLLLIFDGREGRDAERARRSVAEIRTLVLEETDYLREAENLIRARGALTGRADVVVPRTHPELCSRRVLTMDLLEGDHLPQYLAKGPSQAERDRAGTVLFESLAALIRDGSLVHGDPHQGNFMFLPDGRLGILDLGCARRLDDDERALFLEFVRSIHDRGRDLVEPSRILAGLEPGEEPRPGQLEYLQAFAAYGWEPFRHDEPWEWTEEYLRQGVEVVRRHRGMRYTIEPVMAVLARWGPGLGGVFHRLGCRIPLRAVVERMAA